MPRTRYNHEQEPAFRIYYDSKELMEVYPASRKEKKLRPGAYICPVCGRKVEYFDPHLDVKQVVERECNDCRQKRYGDIFAQRWREQQKERSRREQL